MKTLWTINAVLSAVNLLSGILSQNATAALGWAAATLFAIALTSSAGKELA